MRKYTEKGLSEEEALAFIESIKTQDQLNEKMKNLPKPSQNGGQN